MEPIQPPPPDKTAHRKQLTRDQRLQVQALYATGWKYAPIAEELEITHRQVQWAVEHRYTPQNHKSGAHPVIDDISQQILIEFVCASRRNRRMSYLEISLALNWDVSALAIQNSLERAGFLRHVARRKPHISEKTSSFASPGLESTCFGPGFGGILYCGLMKPGLRAGTARYGLQDVVGRRSRIHVCWIRNPGLVGGCFGGPFQGN